MPRTLALALVALPFVTPPAAAQEVKWHHDYTAARKEAAETGRPLLLDFGTESCFYCKKLDATTFRDPKIVARLNGGFVAVKVDANKHPRLTAALEVESFPTLVLAGADGKVIGRHDGYAEVSELTALLNKAPAPRAPVAAKPASPTADLDALFPEIAAKLDR